MSAFPSRTSALLAAPAPLVIPSIFSKSVSLISALPITKLVPAVIAASLVTDVNTAALPDTSTFLHFY